MIRYEIRRTAFGNTLRCLSVSTQMIPMTSLPLKEKAAKQKHSQNRESLPAQPSSIQGTRVGASPQTWPSADVSWGADVEILALKCNFQRLVLNCKLQRYS